MASQQTAPVLPASGLPYAARQLVTPALFPSLIIFLGLDVLIYLLLGGSRWCWWLIFAAEAAALVLSLQKTPI